MFFTVGTTKHWNRLSLEVMEPPLLEVFRTYLAGTMINTCFQLQMGSGVLHRCFHAKLFLVSTQEGSRHYEISEIAPTEGKKQQSSTSGNEKDMIED